MSDRRQIGSWTVDFQQGWLERRYSLRRRRVFPEARLLKVLRVLADNAGNTVTTEAILRWAWPGRVVSRDSVTTAVYQLRQLLGDDKDSPRYIASEPRRGYRLIAKVTSATRARPWQLAGALAVAVCVAWAAMPTASVPSYIHVSRMQNYDESPVQDPLFSAIESTFLSELIQAASGRIRIHDDSYLALRLESMMVACDLGPTLVIRILDTRSNTYIWSEAYNLDEVAASTERPTLVEQAANDVGAAIL